MNGILSLVELEERVSDLEEKRHDDVMFVHKQYAKVFEQYLETCNRIEKISQEIITDMEHGLFTYKVVAILAIAFAIGTWISFIFLR